MPDARQEPLPDPLLVQLVVGSDEIAGEESFEVLVYSADAVTRLLSDGPVLGRHMLIVESLDTEVAVAFLTSAVGQIVGDTWNDLVGQLRQIGAWEFEGYEP